MTKTNKWLVARALASAALELGGLVLVAYGLWLAWSPLGLIGAGLALVNYSMKR